MPCSGIRLEGHHFSKAEGPLQVLSAGCHREPFPQISRLVTLPAKGFWNLYHFFPVGSIFKGTSACYVKNNNNEKKKRN
jgi:hypothetical protein